MDVLQAGIQTTVLEEWLTSLKSSDRGLFKPLIHQILLFLNSDLYRQLTHSAGPLHLTEVDEQVISALYQEAVIVLDNPVLQPAPAETAKRRAIQYLNTWTGTMVDLLAAIQNQKIIQDSQALHELRELIKPLDVAMDQARQDLQRYLSDVDTIAHIAKGLDAAIAIGIKLAALV